MLPNISKHTIAHVMGLGAMVAALSMVSFAHAENLTGHHAVLRALDKVTATTKDFTVPVGEVLHYGALDIAVRHCEKRPPEETPETYVFLQIGNRDQSTGKAQGNEKNQPKSDTDAKSHLFSGWMFASSPALSALDHPVYDVWVLDCLVPEPIVPEFALPVDPKVIESLR